MSMMVFSSADTRTVVSPGSVMFGTSVMHWSSGKQLESPLWSMHSASLTSVGGPTLGSKMN